MRYFRHVVVRVGLWVFLLGLMSAGMGPLAFGVDVFRKATTPYVQFLNVPWGNGGGAFNNTFWFNVLAPEQGVCVYITNNNPSNAHPFSTFTVSTTANPTVPGFTGFTRFWTSVPPVTPVVLPLTITVSSTQAFFFPARGAAFVAVTFAGSTALAGNPDTANIIVVLENTTSCSNSGVFPLVSVIGATEAGNNIQIGTTDFPVLVGGNGQSGGIEQGTAFFADVDVSSHGFIVGTTAQMADNGTGWGQAMLNNTNGSSKNVIPVMPMMTGDDSANPPAVFFSKGSKRFGEMTSNSWVWGSTLDVIGGPVSSYYARTDTVNPAANSLLLGINTSATTLSLMPYRAIMSCSATCDVIINKTTNGGTTCAAVVPVRAFSSAIGVASNVTGVTQGCVANPTVQSQIMRIWIPAGGTQIVDLTGYWTEVSPTGFDLVEGTIVAGTVSVTMEFSDRCPSASCN